MKTSHYLKRLPSLEHHFLVAMPSLENDWFAKSVIYIVEDNAEGTMGITLTHPHELTIGALLNHFDYDIQSAYHYLDTPVLTGGPVDPERGFVLHRPLGNWQTSATLSDRLAMTVSEDLLKDLAKGQGPEHFLMALGYSGWSPGQLAAEIQQNDWLTLPYNESLLFDIPPDQKWSVALSTLGISPAFLSMEAGHA